MQDGLEDFFFIKSRTELCFRDQSICPPKDHFTLGVGWVKLLTDICLAESRVLVSLWKNLS